ncbi:MAG TPA: DUF2079 domain-containing protein [Gemmatimonadota bacterium]|jgi:uncharacterized membrane protein
MPATPDRVTVERPAPRRSQERLHPLERLRLRRAPPPDLDGGPIPADPNARGLVAVAIAAYVIAYSWWTIRNHVGFATAAFDFAIYDQALWLLSRFETPFVTIMGRHLFGDHTSFILLPLVPFYWIAPSGKVLLVAQSAALGIAALPAFLVARHQLRSEMPAALLAVAYLLQPAVGWTNFEQFHPDVFEIPLALLAFWLVLERRWTAFLVTIVALLSVKEDVPLLTAGLGIWVAIFHHRRIGLLTTALSIAWFVAAFWGILPALNGVGTLNTWRIPFGGPTGVIRTALFEPGEFLAYLLSDQRPWYLWQMFAPLALFPLLTPSVFLIAAGPLASNLISTFYYQHRMQHHYVTLLVPVIVVAAIYTVAKARSPRGRRILSGVVLGAATLCAYTWGPLQGSRTPAWLSIPGWYTHANVWRAINLIPRDASVSASYQFVPHVAQRKEIYLWPNPWRAQYWGTFTHEGRRLPQADGVEYVLLHIDELPPDHRRLLSSIRWDFESVYEAENVLLLRRRR